MKKLLYTLLAVSIIFSACEKEEEVTNNTGNNNTTSIIGKWDLKQSGQDRYLIYNNDTISHDIYEIAPVDWDEEIPFNHIEFLSNGEYIRTVFDHDGTETNWFPIYLNGSWIQNNNILYLSGDAWDWDDPTSANVGVTIESLDNTNLTLSYHYSINTGSTESKEELDIVLVYERIN